MGKRPASSKATRGVSKGRRPVSSSSSNPRVKKFRSQYNSLAAIAKGGPSKKNQSKESTKKLIKEAIERKELLNGLDNINILEEGSSSRASKLDVKTKKSSRDNASDISGGSKLTTASFASVWSNCTNASLNEFFNVWNPNLETHKDALAVIAGLSQIMSSSKTDQSDSEYATTLFRILSSPETPVNVIRGALLALTFVMRKLPNNIMNDNFEHFYSVLKNLMEKYYTARGKSLIKCLVRCFSALAKTHPLGKEAIESGLRKKINVAIRKHRAQNKVKL